MKALTLKETLLTQSAVLKNHNTVVNTLNELLSSSDEWKKLIKKSSFHIQEKIEWEGLVNIWREVKKQEESFGYHNAFKGFGKKVSLKKLLEHEKSNYNSLNWGQDLLTFLSPSIQFKRFENNHYKYPANRTRDYLDITFFSLHRYYFSPITENDVFKEGTHQKTEDFYQALIAIQESSKTFTAYICQDALYQRNQLLHVLDNPANVKLVNVRRDLKNLRILLRELDEIVVADIIADPGVPRKFDHEETFQNFSSSYYSLVTSTADYNELINSQVKDAGLDEYIQPHESIIITRVKQADIKDKGKSGDHFSLKGRLIHLPRSTQPVISFLPENKQDDVNVKAAYAKIDKEFQLIKLYFSLLYIESTRCTASSIIPRAKRGTFKFKADLQRVKIFLRDFLEANKDLKPYFTNFQIAVEKLYANYVAFQKIPQIEIDSIGREDMTRLDNPKYDLSGVDASFRTPLEFVEEDLEDSTDENTQWYLVDGKLTLKTPLPEKFE